MSPSIILVVIFRWILFWFVPYLLVSKVFKKGQYLFETNEQTLNKLIDESKNKLDVEISTVEKTLTNMKRNKIYELHNDKSYISSFDSKGIPVYYPLITRKIIPSKVIDVYNELIDDMIEDYNSSRETIDVDGYHEIMPDREIVELPIHEQPDATVFDGRTALSYISVYPELKAYDTRTKQYTFPKS